VRVSRGAGWFGGRRMRCAACSASRGAASHLVTSPGVRSAEALTATWARCPAQFRSHTRLSSSCAITAASRPTPVKTAAAAAAPPAGP
jgi:hypothetical protein